MNRIYPTLAALLVMVSCMSPIDDVPRYVPPLQTIRLSDIEQANDGGRFLLALQLNDRLTRENPEISAESLKTLKASSSAGLRAQFVEAVEKKEFARALALYDSMVVLGETSLAPDWTGAKLSAARSAVLEKKGDLVPAIRSYLQGVDMSALSREQVERLLTMGSEAGDRGLLEYMISRAGSQGVNVSEAMRRQASERTPLGTMIGGTVTIWVNKGVKIEKGSAMPDRVIGSGFFIDKRGYLLTNHHVISSEVDPTYEGFSRLYVRLSDKPDRKIPARVIGWDPVFDLALLKVEVEPKFVFSSTRMTPVQPGEKITVIGSPIGLENTITSGIISATGRRFLQLGDALQIDAPINPGNSGGPVIDEEGRLIGVVFAGIEQFEGINFAIASEWINQVIGRLYQGGEVKHYWMGLALQEGDNGLEVLYVVPGEPADTAGLAVGDVIKDVNGRSVDSIKDLQSLLGVYEAGGLVRAHVMRGAADLNMLVNVGERPRVPVRLALDRDIKSNLIFPLFGMKIEKVGDFYSSHFMVKRVIPGSVADELDLSENDPVSLRNWYIDDERKIVAVDIKVQRKKLGFLEAYIRIYSYLETNNFA
jgi:serine protease Do